MKTTFFALCFAVFFSSVATADNFVVGIEEQEFLPHYSLRSDQFTGFAADLFALFSETSQHKLEFKAIPRQHIVQKLQSGEIDFRYPDNPKWQASIKGADIVYSDNIVAYTEGSLVTKEKAEIGVDGLKTIGIVRGREPIAYLELLNNGKLHARESSDLDTLIKSTLLGRVEAAYYNTEVALYRLNKMGIGNDLLISNQLPSVSGYFSLSTLRHKTLIEEFNQFLQQNQGAIAELKAKYQLQ